MTFDDWFELKRGQPRPHNMRSALREVWETAQEQERERCAKLCEDSDLFEYDDPGGFFARLIRA